MATHSEKSPKPSSKPCRFDARLNEGQRLLIERAADLEGRTLTDFVLHSAESAAERTIRERTTLLLSARDSEAFVGNSAASSGTGTGATQGREALSRTFRTVKTASPVSIAPLPDRNDRSSFISGVPELDRYFQQQAGQDAKRKLAAPFVLLDQGDTVIGYYTLSAYNISLAELPAETAKKLPRYPMMPATLLGRLAVSRDHQGRKLGQFLLLDALRRSTRAIDSVGLVVDAMSDDARRFFQHHEFQLLPGHAGKLFLSMVTIRKLFAD